MDKARETALRALIEIETKDAYSNLVLKKLLKSSALDVRDRAFITELVYGTVTRKLTLDWIISQYSKIKLKKMSKYVLQILRMGVYQLIFLDRVPQSAACNTSVELSKKYAKASAGFVNAILRNISRDEININGVNTGTKIGDLSVRYSFPEYLVEEWLSQFGEDSTEQLLAAMLERPDFSVRVNTLKATRDKVISELMNEGIEVRSGRFLDEALILSNTSDISETKPFEKGEITVQDESSMLVAKILDPKPFEKILDTCAAPGGKTTHIAQYMKNEGHITAWDIHEHKVKLILDNAARLGIEIIEAVVMDATMAVNSENEYFDKVLADVPCSGTGIIRRKPDIKWQRGMDDYGNLVEIQKKILYNASRYVKHGGVLVYSTCSLDERENAQVVKAFLSANNGFEPEPLNAYLPEPLKAKKGVDSGMLSLYPHIDGTDGFFIARLRRKH